ncbi:hypothetical protein J1605_003393 [Eschrichtius robustus]|uniref:Uncharacterized protein n=1 Tax=Eschrichtius robustus TaxID=9764 RepID=A0AB34HP19_ESCRO|nr:hypothetical protein J1605_003393 [Eschrichtius robustus]
MTCPGGRGSGLGEKLKAPEPPAAVSLRFHVKCQIYIRLLYFVESLRTARPEAAGTQGTSGATAAAAEASGQRLVPPQTVGRTSPEALPSSWDMSAGGKGPRDFKETWGTKPRSHRGPPLQSRCPDIGSLQTHGTPTHTLYREGQSEARSSSPQDGSVVTAPLPPPLPAQVTGKQSPDVTLIIPPPNAPRHHSSEWKWGPTYRRQLTPQGLASVRSRTLQSHSPENGADLPGCVLELSWGDGRLQQVVTRQGQQRKTLPAGVSLKTLHSCGNPTGELSPTESTRPPRHRLQSQEAECFHEPSQRQGCGSAVPLSGPFAALPVVSPSSSMAERTGCLLARAHAGVCSPPGTCRPAPLQAWAQRTPHPWADLWPVEPKAGLLGLGYKGPAPLDAPGSLAGMCVGMDPRNASQEAVVLGSRPEAPAVSVVMGTGPADSALLSPAWLCPSDPVASKAADSLGFPISQGTGTVQEAVHRTGDSPSQGLFLVPSCHLGTWAPLWRQGQVGTSPVGTTTALGSLSKRPPDSGWAFPPPPLPHLSRTINPGPQGAPRHPPALREPPQDARALAVAGLQPCNLLITPLTGSSAAPGVENCSQTRELTASRQQEAQDRCHSCCFCQNRWGRPLHPHPPHHGRPGLDPVAAAWDLDLLDGHGGRRGERSDVIGCAVGTTSIPCSHFSNFTVLMAQPGPHPSSEPVTCCLQAPPRNKPGPLGWPCLKLCILEFRSSFAKWVLSLADEG